MEKFFNTEITEELKQSFLDYSMSVITDRALPDVRSGLKPIHTRILYGAYQLGLKSDKPFKKSAKLVGHIIGTLSPHRDEATYQAIVKLVQDFYLRYPLMLGEGAWGSQDGDAAAAYRYTLCKLSKYGELMLDGIKTNAVDFKPNFSNDDKEPVVMPALFPALICNGTSGIATGIASKFAPHNLTEVCDAIVYFIEKGGKIENVTTTELLKYIQGPDSPSGGIVINKSALEEFYEYGKGSIKIQGVYKFEKNGKHSNIVFTEIPYCVSKEKLIEKIASLCAKGDLNNIIDIRDESTFKNGVRFVIETSLKEDDELELLVNLLFDKTDLETSFSINQNAIVEGAPKLVSLKEMIFYYYQHQKDVFFRISKNEQEKLLVQLEKLDGLLIALAHIEDIIQLIKTSENKNVAKDKLMEKYKFTELQAETILEMKLARLTKIDGVEIKSKQEQIDGRLKELNKILNNEEILNQELIKKIRKMQKEYGDNRRTLIVDKIREKTSAKKAIVNEDTTVLISTKGEIKRINDYKKTTAALVATVKSNTASIIGIFTDSGTCYKVAVKKIPVVLKNGDKGEKLSEFNIPMTEKILGVFDVNDMNKSLYIVTYKGYYKQIDLNECSSNRTVKYTSLKDEDKVVYISTKNIKQLKVKTNKEDRVLKNFPTLKRTALGVKEKTWKEDEVVEKV